MTPFVVLILIFASGGSQQLGPYSSYEACVEVANGINSHLEQVRGLCVKIQ